MVWTALPQSGHRDDGVPKGGRNTGELGVGIVLLAVIHNRGEYDDGHGKGKDQKAQLGSTAFERVTEYPKS